jgi:hypothetical protein
VADFRSPSRAGGARVLPHHTRLNRDRLSATQNFWNPPSSSRVLLFAIRILYPRLCLVTSRSYICFMLISASYHLRNRSRLLFRPAPQKILQDRMSHCTRVKRDCRNRFDIRTPYITRTPVSVLFSMFHLTLIADEASILVTYKRTTILAQKYQRSVPFRL